MLRLNLSFFSTLKISDVVCKKIFLENISLKSWSIDERKLTDALWSNNNEQKLQELNETSDLLQLNKCAKNWSYCKYSNKEKALYWKCNMSAKLKLKPNLSKIDSKKSVKCWLKSKSKTFFEKTK